MPKKLEKPGPETKVMTGLRFKPSLKAALVKAAAADDRTVNGLVERVLSDYCREHGFLK
jgi:hypothetical protein